LWEVVSNICDQIIAGACTHTDVEIGADHSITLRDNGPGFVDIELERGGETVPILTIASTELHNTPSLTGHVPHDHAGLHGVGLVVVSALSRWMTVQTIRDGVERRIRTKRQSD
jgi:DNA gyrase subunit B